MKNQTNKLSLVALFALQNELLKLVSCELQKLFTVAISQMK